VSEPIDRATYYSSEESDELTQGDVLIDVPLVVPPLPELYLVRGVGKQKLDQIPANGPIFVDREQSIPDAFGQGEPEFGICSFQRSAVMLLTPTCDIDSLDLLLVCPVKQFETQDHYWKQTFSLRSSSAFPVVEYGDEYSDSYADFTNITVTSKELLLKAEVKLSISEEMQSELSARICDFLGRLWGFRKDEIAPKAGYYRCLRCAQHYPLQLGEPSPPVIELKKGDAFPECANCKKVHKSAQFRFMSEHKK
jgi:hypothetical protein